MSSSMEQLERFLKISEELVEQLTSENKALKAALAQGETSSPRAAQEPVAGTKTWFEDNKVVTQYLTAKDIYKEPEQELQKEGFGTFALGAEYTTTQQRKPLTSQKVLNLKDAFYAGFDAYDTPAAPYSDVDEKWSEYKTAHGITAAPEKGN